MKTFKLFSMAALALVMAACSSEDNALENATPAQPGLIPFSATVAPLSGATTRTVYTPGTDGESKPIINVAWKEGDQIFITRLTPDLGTAGTVTVGEPNGDGSAPLSGNISGADGSEIEAQYPASAASAWDTFTEKYKAQDGTLSGIQDNLDYRKGTGEISVIGGKATLADKLQMKSQIAIWKLTLQNTSGANLNATKVTIKDGSNIIAATKDISATSEVYMAVPFNTSPTTFSDLTIEATTADGTYTYAAPIAVNLSHSTYYQSTVKMAKPLSLTSPAVGQVIGSDGKNYNVADVPSGVDKVAMIAYVSGSNGLALALADKGFMNWATAKSTCEAKTPAFTGGTWKLPTKEEWNLMFSANGGSEGSYTGLNTALAAAGGDGSKLQDDIYWSSTPYSEIDAWYVHLYEGTHWSNLGKGKNGQVRACLAFGYARGHALASSAVGEIVGSDGLAYYASDKNDLPSGVTAVAIVAYKGSETGESSPYTHGLAIAMKDAAAGNLQWKTSTGSKDNPKQYTDPASAIAAKESGSTLSAGRDNSTWPAFEAALHNTITTSDGISAAAPASGTSGWFLPSLYQWNMIVKGLSGQSADLSNSSNDDYKASSLNTKITAAGGDGLRDDGYLSSTEYGDMNAWGFDAFIGSVGNGSKDIGRYVRSAFAF